MTSINYPARPSNKSSDLLQPGLPHVHLAMSGRSRPALPLAGLRSRGELLEFEVDALRFGATEIDAMFSDLTPAQRDLLNTRTQGWPVALQLARLWITAQPDRAILIAGYSGRTFEVAEVSDRASPQRSAAYCAPNLGVHRPTGSTLRGPRGSGHGIGGCLVQSGYLAVRGIPDRPARHRTRMV